MQLLHFQNVSEEVEFIVIIFFLPRVHHHKNIKYSHLFVVRHPNVEDSQIQLFIRLKMVLSLLYDIFFLYVEIVTKD